MSEVKDIVVSEGWHWTYGWLRRSDIDTVYGGSVYEDGDGTIMVFKDAIHKKGVYLQCCKDHETGELYLRTNSVYKLCNWRSKLRIKYKTRPQR